jgi:tetratricopeptide (TPR) repeat protein
MPNDWNEKFKSFGRNSGLKCYTFELGTTVNRSMKILTLTGLLLFSLVGKAQNLSAEKNYEQGQLEHSRGRFDKAIEQYNECLKKNPSFKEAYTGRAASKEQLLDLAGALTDYSIAIDLSPDNYDATLGRANVLYKLGRFSEAKEEYLKLLSLPPGETNTIYFQKSASPTGTMQITTAQSDLRPLILNYIGLTELKLRNFKQAKLWFDSALGFSPREADYYVNRGLAKTELQEENAVQDFERALKINPAHTAALAAMATTGQSDDKQKEDYLQHAIESDSTAVHPYLERGYQRLLNGFYKGALDDYNHALRIEEKNPEIWLNRGFVKEKMNDLAGAYRDYTMAITLKEDYPQAWLNRGNLLQRQGRLEQALEDYSIAIIYNPEYGAAYYNRAIVKERLKRKEESCLDARKAEELGVAVNEKLKLKVCN